MARKRELFELLEEYNNLVVRQPEHKYHCECRYYTKDEYQCFCTDYCGEIVLEIKDAPNPKAR